MSDQKANLLLFSADYDKALAAFIIANGARELEMDTTMFFAFWGLLLLRDPEKMTLEDKSLFEQMFTLTTPNGAAHLPLSKMNMGGLGKMMLLDMMEDEGTPGLPAFIKGAQNKGVHFCACKLSLDIMGFKLEELVSGVEVMNVKEYIKNAASAELQLFI